MMPAPHALAIAVLLVATLAAYAALALWYPLGYIWATYEDLYGEWGQTYLFAVAAVGFALVGRSMARYRWSAVALAVASAYVFFEEISWGQRVFGFASPEFFSRNNLQGETNLHNFLTGPYATSLKQTIRFAMTAAIASYGAVLPLALRRGHRAAAWLDRRGLLLPPLCLAPVFAVAAFFEARPFGFNEAELAELLVAFGLAATAAYYLMLAAEPAGSPPASLPIQQHSGAFALRLLGIVAVAVSLAIATTSVVYASAAHRAGIDRRIENGMQRFAQRYSRYGRWDTVVGIYEYLLADEPDSSYRMRSLARAHRELGHDAQFAMYAQRAADADLERYRAEPWRASVLRSLVRDYRLLGDSHAAERYLAEAESIGLMRITEHPESPTAAYSLGRTYALAGRDDEALAQYARAFELRPESGRYRQAYLSALH
jgi:tetratricopeptide (TPR) repeat protein